MPKEALAEDEAVAVLAVLADRIERRGVRAVIPRREPKEVSLWKLAGRAKRMGRRF